MTDDGCELAVSASDSGWKGCDISQSLALTVYSMWQYLGVSVYLALLTARD